MKTMKTTLTAVFLSSALFTACTKSNDMAVVPSANSTTAKTTAAADESLARFHRGHIMSAYMRVIISPDEVIQFKGLTRLDLFTPIVEQGLDIPIRQFDQLGVEIQATPYDTRAALALEGNVVFAGGETIPVSFVINDRITIQTKSRFVVLNDQSNILDLLLVKPDLVSAGITEDMWQNAERVNDVVLVSANVNQELYIIMLQNLREILNIRFDEIARPVPDPVAPDPVYTL